MESVGLTMWIPKNEQEIVDAVTSGLLEESPIFDVKRELPAKNAEIAKDIAAMANDGGVLIYGIDEDPQGRPTILSPIQLAGQRERISSIAQMAIAESPEISIAAIPTAADVSRGYIVVLVPPSERAPHMVVVKGENRYHGRAATGNFPLSEGEVARLYERRRRWEVDREALLSDEIQRAPLPPRPGFAYLHAFARPVARNDELLGRAAREDQSVPAMLNDLISLVSSPTLFARNYSPDFDRPTRWIHRPHGFLGWLAAPNGPDDADAPANTLTIQADFDGTGHLFCGRAAQQHQGYLFFPPVVAGNTVRFIALLGELYRRAGYVGMVDVAVAITGLKGSVPYTGKMPVRHTWVPYDLDEYRRTARISALLFKDDPIGVGRTLLMPILNAVSQGLIDPFR